MDRFFCPSLDDCTFIIRMNGVDQFSAQAFLDTGSSFDCILPRRKIAQLGLECKHPTCSERANCGCGPVDLYAYEGIEVVCPVLGKSAVLMVYGVHPSLLPEGMCKVKKPNSSTSSSSSAQASTLSPRRHSSRASFPISPCKLNQGAVIDAEFLVGLPGLKKLGMVIDFAAKRVRAVKRELVAKKRRWISVEQDDEQEDE